MIHVSYGCTRSIARNITLTQQKGRKVILTRGAGSRGECGVPFAQRFHMPTKFGGNGNFWYSFEYGPVRVVTISTGARRLGLRDEAWGWG